MNGADGDDDMTMDQQPGPEGKIIDHISIMSEHIVNRIQVSTSETIGELKREMSEFYSSLQNATSRSHGQSNDSRPLPALPRSDADVAQLQKDYDSLTESYQLSETKRISLEHQLQAREQKTKDLEIALQKSTLESKRLHSIIIKSSTPNTGPLDDQIRAEFCGIRSSILKICRNYYQAPSVSLPSLRKDSLSIVERQHAWLGQWKHMTPEVRNYCVQACMFHILDGKFFSRPVYGLEYEMETQLRSFEEWMKECKEIRGSDFVEWRRQTVTSAQFLRKTHSESKESVAERAAHKIIKTLEPALTQPGSLMRGSKLEQLRKDVDALCSQALQHAIALRSSKTIFRVVSPEINQPAAIEDPEMELVAMEGKAGSSNTKVFFVVFGGLEKIALSPSGSLEPPTRLEKAQVVGRAD